LALLPWLKKAQTLKIPTTFLSLSYPAVEGPEIKFYYVYPKHLKESYRVQALGAYLHEVVIREELGVGKEAEYKVER
jgi:hypothetical protein